MEGRSQGSGTPGSSPRIPGDSPKLNGSSPRHNGSNAAAAAAAPASPHPFLHDHDEIDEIELRDSEGGEERDGSHGGYSRPDQVFDLTMDYSDEDVLLDWEQYAGMKRVRCCGCDWSWLARVLPCLPWVPPKWWFSYGRRQRRVILAVAGCLAALLGLILLLVFAAEEKVFTPAPDLAAYSECNWQDFSLPNTTLPRSYNLSLSADFEEPFAVVGMVEIEAEIARPTPCIVLHAVGMDVTHAHARSPKSPHMAGKVHSRPNEQLLLTFDGLLPAGPATLELHFNYTLSEGMGGFYRSKYTASDNTTQTLAATQFEAANARRAFPCFDKPALKAIFHVTLTAPAGLVALSNMPERPGSAAPLPDGKLRRSFLPTPPMSTYLLAFVIGDLRNVSTEVANPVKGKPARPISVWGVPGREGTLSTARDMAAAILPAYETLFDYPYALPKLDLVAIPDFAAGAMENWGLITYRETALLVSEATGLRRRRYVARTIAHEMAHLWFGDLVTLRSWGELWLNEGFAAYLEYLGATAAAPADRHLDDFFVATAARGMAVDAKNASTHPLSVHEKINSVDMIESFFDGVSYDKGAAVLRMVRAYMARNSPRHPPLRRRLMQAPAPKPAWVDALMSFSEPPDPWLTGIRSYLKAHAYKTATSEDVWEHLSQATDEDLEGSMERWTGRKGFPLLTLRTQGDQVVVDQAPFTVMGPGICSSANKSTAPWWVPIPFTSSSSPAPQWTTIKSCNGSPLYKLKGPDDWVKANAAQLGFFRVDYDPQLWDRLTQAAGVVNTAAAVGAAPVPVMEKIDLTGLLDDSYALADAGVQPITIFLGLTRALSERRLAESQPWEGAIGQLVNMRIKLSLDAAQTACLGAWAAFVREDLTGPMLSTSLTGTQVNIVVNATNAAEESLDAALMQPLLLDLAGRANDPTVLYHSAILLQAAQAGNAAIDADIRSSVYSNAVRSGDTAAFELMKTIYVTTRDIDEKDRALGALTQAPNTSLIEEVLAMSLGRDVRPQDIGHVVEGVAGQGGEALRLAWAFLTRNFDIILQKLGGPGDSTAATEMARMVTHVGSLFADSEAQGQMEELFRMHSRVLTERSYLEAAKERIAANSAWLTRNAGPACLWLDTGA